MWLSSCAPPSPSSSSLVLTFRSDILRTCGTGGDSKPSSFTSLISSSKALATSSLLSLALLSRRPCSETLAGGFNVFPASSSSPSASGWGGGAAAGGGAEGPPTALGVPSAPPTEMVDRVLAAATPQNSFVDVAKKVNQSVRIVSLFFSNSSNSLMRRSVSDINSAFVETSFSLLAVILSWAAWSFSSLASFSPSFVLAASRSTAFWL
mmetsp:Transcript_14949/g.27760  ORF Transcript_14949/g.27760 Transcript_14949/m.27760 type:complete len:208 (-) Transcript_14949:1475-2098(-)